MTETTLTLFSALLAGLLGSLHCIAMCGGIAGSLGVAANSGTSKWSRFSRIAAYNAGRIGSYSLAGLFAGLLGGAVLQVLPVQNPHKISLWVSAFFIIALGLYISDWWRGLVALEKSGAYLWRWIEPAGRRFLPPKTLWQAFFLGGLWGWLPCGLVYSILAFAVAAGEPLHGAALMLVFGLGTLPMLLALGFATQYLQSLRQNIYVRRIAGSLLIAAGLFMLSAPRQGAHAHHHHISAAEQQAYQG